MKIKTSYFQALFKSLVKADILILIKRNLRWQINLNKSL